MSRRAALAALLFALGAGCRPSLPGSYRCDTSSQCISGGTPGVCEPSGACSFPDATCASGRRYGHYGPAGLAGACVDDGAPDLATGDAAPAAASITRVGATKLPLAQRATAAMLPAPSGLAADDVLLACLYAGDNTTTFTPPAGWTLHADLGGDLSGSYHAVWYTHVAAAGEPAAYAFAITNGGGTSAVAAAVVAYRHVAPAAPIDAAANRRFQAMPLAAPSITTTHAGDMLVAMFVDATQSLMLGAPAGMSAAVTDQAIYIFDGLQPDPGASGVKAANQIPGLGAVDFVALAPAAP